MKNNTILFFCLLNPNLFSVLYAQDSLQNIIRFPEGISIGYGIGNFAVKDEYISKEKYTGSVPYFNLGWTNQHQKYVYQLRLTYRYSSDIKNHNISAEIYHFSLTQGFLYSITDFSILNRNAFLYFGPSTELFLYYNNQNIAVSGFDYSNSFAILLSLGLNSKLIYPISRNLVIESSVDFSVLSFGIRMVDNEETNESPVKPLTLLKGLNASIHLGTRYYLSEKLSAGIKYLFHVTRITSWDPLHSASDNMVLDLAYTF